MKTAIFQVLSNLNHNGVIYKTGQFIEHEVGAFATLMEDNVVKVITGATTVEEAEKIVADGMQADAEANASEEAPKEQNTWQAEPDQKPEVAAGAPAGDQTTGEQVAGATDQNTANVDTTAAAGAAAPTEPVAPAMDPAAGANL